MTTRRRRRRRQARGCVEGWCEEERYGVDDDGRVEGGLLGVSLQTGSMLHMGLDLPGIEDDGGNPERKNKAGRGKASLS
eukprot:9498391-Pyramimonas_sp.AAC.1